MVKFSWVGAYEVIAGPTAPSFTISIFGDDTVSGPYASQPGAELFSQNVGTASETIIPGADFFRYDADITPFPISAGKTYWFSVVANMDIDDNVFRVAFSGIGDKLSFQDFGELLAFAPDRFDDPVDYAFSVQTVVPTVVPEPASFLPFAAIWLCGVTGHRRRRA